MAVSSPPRRGGQAAPRAPRGLITALVVVSVVVVALAVVVGLLARGTPTNTGVQGSGVAATQPRVLPPFTSVDMAGSSNVTVVVGGRQSVMVHADDNLMGYVSTGVTAGTLVIGTTGSFTPRSPMNVEVSVPSLAAVTLSGSGQISVTGIHAARLTVTLPGSGALYADGTVTKLDVSLGGSGLAQLDGLVARDAHAVVSGSGLIRVAVTASLNATVSGSGAILYSGDPQVTSNVTGSGAVTRG